MDYEEFEKAVDTMGILTRISKIDLKQKYLKLSKRYHPDMPEGSAEKFLEVKEAYDLLSNYIDTFCFNFNKEEFIQQHPSFTNYKNWNR
jgi:preprotein translocase subunit Sec63